jgi:hypothetical protein
MSWWEHGYPGGKMVPLPGFPRPLYWPGAPGHEPSSDGPDVIGYKRTVSRAGRWPWQKFDDSYSRAFATGRSGNVSETGVAGVQRQLGIDDTGFIGRATFNGLRSIIIPSPLPHAGEYAMDANAQTLIAEAYYLFNPPTAPARTVREQALALAQQYIGLTEEPTGSNMTPFGKWYGMDGVPWCAIFCTYCFECGPSSGSPSFAQGSRYAYVPYIVADALNGDNGLEVTDDPQPGDLVCFDWDGGEADHVGFYESGDVAQFTTVEGNTAVGNDSNGGQVMRRQRDIAQAYEITFVRVAEP